MQVMQSLTKILRDSSQLEASGGEAIAYRSACSFESTQNGSKEQSATHLTRGQRPAALICQLLHSFRPLLLLPITQGAEQEQELGVLLAVDLFKKYSKYSASCDLSSPALGRHAANLTCRGVCRHAEPLPVTSGGEGCGCFDAIGCSKAA
jgi:hypothetical protein